MFDCILNKTKDNNRYVKFASSTETGKIKSESKQVVYSIITGL